MSDFLSVDEFAARLKISRSTLYELVKQKRIAHLRIGDRILFDPEKAIRSLEIDAESDRPSVVRTKGRHQVAQNE